MRRHRPLFVLLAAIIGVPAATLHCSSGPDVGTSESDHTAGEMTLHNTPFVFAETDYESFRQGGGFGSMLAGQTLPPDDVVTVRVQLWLDRLHEAVRASVKKRTGRELAAPRPIAKVSLSPMANAWVTPVEGCAQVPVDFSRITPPPTATATAFPTASGSGTTAPPWATSTGTVSTPPPTGPAKYARPTPAMITTDSYGTCVTPRNWDPLGAPAWWSSLGKACTFEMLPDGKAAALGEKCIVMPYAPSAENLVLKASSSFIHITAKMISMLDDERGMAAILAHELGHYYRAHVTGLGEYDYWFEQHSPPRPGKPLPVADSEQFGELYAKHSYKTQAPPIEGEKLSPRLRATAILIAREAAALEGVDASCKELGAAIGTPWMTKVVSGSPLAPEEVPLYRDFEGKLLGCAERVKVADPAEAGSLQWPQVNSYFSYVTGQEPLPKNVPLSVVFQVADARARALDAESAAFRAEMNRRHLGHYTFEQEADDFSMELLSLAGLDPKEHVEAWLGFTKALNDDPATKAMFASDGIPFEECVQLFHDGWMRKAPDGSAEAVFVPMGSPHGHHGFCYRLFNLSRELLAHEYTPSGRGPETSVPWSTVQAHAKELAAQPLVPPSPSPSIDGGAPEDGGTPDDGGADDGGAPPPAPLPTAIIDHY